MKKFFYLIGGIAAATACVLMTRTNRKGSQSVDVLAHRLQDAWADHHTVA
jgi:hypothetical protein